MRAHHLTILTISSAVLLPVIASAHGRPKPPPAPFDTASICVERNATDGDTEIVLQAVPGDEGLQHFQVRSPDGRRVFTFQSPDPTILGMREFNLESPEPEGDRILAAYPAGTYYFWGHTHAGDKFFSTPRLSHQLPNETVIINPIADAVVPAGALTIQWSPVPGVSQYLLELENESVDPEQSLSFNLPPDVTSFEVPASLLTPGSEYQVGIGTVLPNCNIVFVESAFQTAE